MEERRGEWAQQHADNWEALRAKTKPCLAPASTSLARYTAPYLADRSRHRIAERCLISWIGNGLSTKIFNTVPDFRPMSRPSLPAGPPTTWAVAETQTA